MEEPVSHSVGHRSGDSVVFHEPPEGAQIETRDGAIVAVRVGGRRFPVRAIAVDGVIHVWCNGETYEFTTRPAAAVRSRPADEEGLRAPMPGRILRTMVKEGERVGRGAVLVILEAMKMEHEIKAPRDGVVARLPFQAGDQVDAGAVLVDFTG
jgi:biotin carboxyl carrier protein